MWITYFNWFMALLSIFIWVVTYIVWQRDKVMPWFDNKFGRDDPMPPTPKQQINPINVGDNSEINYKKTQASESKKD
ncbi:unnamed protein product [Commensalibacter communis]|uniref:hypothetical protein n=1 Tax=Commensalibacter communis TaxID=2972786 RepID=UPI0022FF5792|nr:hypothetical protein [Commensalibacter communis]CAI3946090.1 unnamed protein product [Commensalibacter communis]